MKKLFLLAFILIASLTFGQSTVQTVNASTTIDTTVTDSVYYTSNVTFPEYYYGIGGFQYTFTAGSSDSLEATLEGSFDNTNWVTVSSSAVQGAGTYVLSDAPTDYWYYRLNLNPQHGDSVFVGKVIVFKKEE